MSDKSESAADVIRDDPDTMDLRALVGPPVFSWEQLNTIKTYDDALELSQQEFGTILDTEFLTDGFKLLESKDELIGKPFHITQWSASKNGQFLIVRAVMKEDDRKVLFLDGSTGICRQLLRITMMDGRTGGLNVHDGLRKSDPYDVKDENGKVLYEDVVTYYLA